MNWLVIGLAFALAMIFLTQVRSGWRSLLLLVVPIGFLQEPIRKLTTGQPVTMQLLAVGVFGSAVLVAITKFGKPTLQPLSGGRGRTRTLLVFFVGLTLLQAMHSLARFGTPMVPMLGLLSYLLPIPALWVAYVYVRTVADIRRFLKLYALTAATTTLSVIASFNGVDDPVFKQVGDTPMVVYHQLVGVVELYCGFLRSPEVAAWHAAAAACAAATIAISFSDKLFRILAPAIVLSGFFTVVLTGRRKALAIMALYAVFYTCGLLLAKRRSARTTALAGLVVGVALVVGSLAMAPESSDPNPHMERSATVFDDALERFEQLGIGSVRWAYDTGGIVGLGTGAGAQGTQHIAGTTIQGSAEGGLGRIMLELGVLGLLLAVVCSMAVFGTVRRCLRDAYHSTDQLYKLALGAVAFVGANVPIFIGAAQVFGDPFVLIILGMNLGFVLAVPRIIKLQNMHRQRIAAA